MLKDNYALGWDEKNLFGTLPSKAGTVDYSYPENKVEMGNSSLSIKEKGEVRERVYGNF